MQPLQAFFFLTATACIAARSIGSHFVTGRSRSAGSRREVGSILGVAGATVIAQRAFLLAVGVRRGRATETFGVGSTCSG